MKNIWEHPTDIAKEALSVLDRELKYFRNSITDIIHCYDCPETLFYNDDHSKRYIDGVHQYYVSMEITVRDSYLPMNEFSQRIIVPAMTALAHELKELKGEYALYRTSLPENKMSADCYDRNIGIRLTRQYDIETRKDMLRFDITLIEIKEICDDGTEIRFDVSKAQAKRLEVVHWLLHPNGNRATGRTYLMALSFAMHALHSDEWVQVFNHDTHPRSKREMVERIAHIIYESPGLIFSARGVDGPHPEIRVKKKGE